MSNHLTLENVLFIPQFRFNGKYTNQLIACVIFEEGVDDCGFCFIVKPVITRVRTKFSEEAYCRGYLQFIEVLREKIKPIR